MLPRQRESAIVYKLCLTNGATPLLDEWGDSIPAISVASCNTLISQFNHFVTIMKDDVRKEEWALHDMPYLLMQTLSQLWDIEDNVDVLVIEWDY